MKSTRILSSSILTLVALAGVARQAHGQAISITAPTVYTQNFDALGTTTNLWTDGVTLPGWYAGINANNTPDGNVQAADGFTNGLTGLLNMGDTGAVDRALGSKATSTGGFANIAYGVLFQNTSSNPLRILNIGYAGEMWLTNSGSVVERLDTYYKIAATEFFDVEPGGSAAAPNLGSFTNYDPLDWTSPTSGPNSTRLDGNLAANRTELSANPNLTLQPGEFFMFRWVDTNLGSTDGYIGIDDFSISFLEAVINTGVTKVYNSDHNVTVGGVPIKPNGVLEASAAQYWFGEDGVTPTGLVQGDSVVFEAGVTATIDVPQAIVLDTVHVIAESGTYTFSGLGGITSDLVKRGAGGLVLASANSFGNVTIHNGGTIVAQGPNAFSSANLTMTAGATLDVDDTAVIAGPVSGTGPFVKQGIGSLRFGGGALPNDYTGTTTVAEGELILSKAVDTVAIPGDLIIEAGASVRYTGNNIGNQIVDTATITINGGEFGDVTLANPTNPGAPETVAGVVMNGGQFSTGRAVFTATNDFVLNSGEATSHRGGTLTVGNALTVGGTLQLHGGSTTAGQESRVIAGIGGVTLNNGTVNFNMGQTVSATSTGSIFSLSPLGGGIVSTGNSAFVRQNAGIIEPKADLDFGGFDRTIDVTGTLRIGATGASVLIQNGGVVKTGPGTLVLGGDQIYFQPTAINAGNLQVDGSLASSAVNVNSGGTLSGIGTLSGVVTVANGGAITPGINGTGILTIATLNLGAGAADTSTLTFSNGLSPTQINVSATNGLTAVGGAGTVSVNLIGDIPQLGLLPLINYEGTLTPDSFAAFKLGTLPNRVEATLTNDLAGTLIGLDVTSVDQPVWSGNASTEWSTNAIGAPKNWVLLSNAATTTDFLTNDSVLFNDQGATDLSGNVVVDISEMDVTPSGIRFANGTKPYVITGDESITGSTSLTKENDGSVTINNVNSFTGGVVINGGSISVAALANSGVDSALGAGNFISLDGSGALEVTGPASTTNRALNVGLVGGALVIPGELTLSGAISGVGDLAKTGVGRVILTGANTGFAGRLAIREGAVQYTGDTIGGVNETVLIDGGTLENNDVVETVFNDAAAIARTLSVGALGGTINILNATGAVLLARNDGIINPSGPSQLAKTGPGILRVRGANASLSVGWVLNGGTIEVGATNALGSGQVVVADGLLASQNIAVQNPIAMNGGALGTRSGDLADFQGAVDILGPSQAILRSYTTPANSQTITISGVVAGNADFTITGNVPQTQGGNKALVLTNTANTYSGTFLVTPGQFLTAQPVTNGTTLGTATISLEDAGLNIRDNGLGDNLALTYNNPVTVIGTGLSTIDVNRGNGASQGNTVQFTDLTIGAQTLAVTGGNGYKAAFSGTTTLTGAANFQPSTAELILEGNVSGSFGFTKSGTGRMVVRGNTTFVGPVTVQNGNLAIDGSTVAGSDFTVETPGVLSGTGTIGGNVNVTTGTLAPGSGNPVGILNVDGNLTLAAGGSFTVDLSHVSESPVAGFDYDQVNVGSSGTSSVSLGGATLNITLGLGVVQNDIFFILLNDGADAINGTFAGLADNATFSAGGQFFQISYNGDSTLNSLEGGNDIALMAVPEPGSVMLIAGGLLLLAGRRRRD